MKIKSGYPFYGQDVGVLVFSTVTPRIPGDAGNAHTFPFPVRYEIVQGGFADLIKGSDTIKENLRIACENLKKVGIKAIVGDCGLMSLYQDYLAEIISLPIAASSLCQIPLIWELIGRNGKIGIITGHSELLSLSHLENSGWHKGIGISIKGLQDEDHFNEIVIQGGLHLHVDKMRKNILHAVGDLLNQEPDIKALLFECSNIATFSNDVAEEYCLPVFDVFSVAQLLEYSVNPRKFIS